ncbi:hypothetical protein [Phenylobacterium sp. RIFCSPHIGHO2_01_FULL_69_31]|uniref:hypothetical protein n=1 Tax=Phenylobacterium sp. RIFCSPHIGHO2_01_FULL_69_31 TaxID=1801944 RepID=UPI0025E652A5|nr:hypothetical protein [Phenylobacterium sp. RIFCSPHIGHO2_01_FULL_69_31]
MAHFKRGYPHTVWRTAPQRLTITPSGWNTLHHSRPRRRRNTILAHAIKTGRDPDEIVWPTEKRPHRYYW